MRLSGPFNCPFLVFGVVLFAGVKLNICYALKQIAEIFAAFRSISHRILEKKT